MSSKLVEQKAHSKLLVYLVVVSLFVDLVSAETEYERKSRYKDCGLYVTTAGCPNPAETEMLRCMNAILSCPDGEQYHCTRQKENPTYYIDGCAKSKWCLDGEAPYLKFKDEYGRPSTNLHIVCDWCHNENFYNSADRTNSSTYFECKKKVRCDFKYGFECHIAYPDVFKHNRKCGCDTSADAIFRNDNIDLKNASQVDSHFCTSVSISNVVECIYSPCSVGYERSKNQSCVKKPLPSSSHPTYKPTESLNDDSSVSTSQRVPQKQPQAPTVAEPHSDNTGDIIGGVIGALFVIAVVCIGLAASTRRNTGEDEEQSLPLRDTSTTRNTREDEEQSHPLADTSTTRNTREDEEQSHPLADTSTTRNTREDEEQSHPLADRPPQIIHNHNTTYKIEVKGDLYHNENNREVHIGHQSANYLPQDVDSDVDMNESANSQRETSQENETEECSANIEGPDKVSYSKTTNDETPEAGADRMDEDATSSQPNDTGNNVQPIIHHHHNYAAPYATNIFGGDNDIGTINCNPPTGQLFPPEPNMDFKSMDDSSHTQPDEYSEIGESLKTDGSAEINEVDAFDLESLKKLNTKLKPLKILDVLKKKKDNFEAFYQEAVRVDKECEEYISLRKELIKKIDVKISDDQIEALSVYCPAGYQRLKSTGDGNCLFNSVSLLLFGTEEFSSFLRLHTVITAALNWNWYIKQCEFLSSKWNLSVMNYLEIDGLTPKETDEKRRADAVKRFIIEVATNYQYMNPHIHMQFLSDAIKRKIFQYFEANMANYVMENPAKQYDEVVPCPEEDICDTPIHILWVNMSGNTKDGLNHIVPLVKMS